MIKKTCLFVLLFPLISSAQIQWQRCLGGSDGDAAHSVLETFDGGHMVAGSCNSNDGDVSGKHGSLDAWIIKLSATGSFLWQKCMGGSGEEAFFSIRPTSDSGFILVGHTTSTDNDVSGNHGGDDIWVVKLTKTGVFQWQKCLGGSGVDVAIDVQQTNDKGYIIAGYSTSSNGDIAINHGVEDIWVSKLDSSGNLQWGHTFGGSSYEYPKSICQTNDGGYIVAGYTASSDGDVSGFHSASGISTDCWVIKLSSSGSLQWQKCYGGSRSDAATGILQTADGNYILVGSTASSDGDVSGLHSGIGVNSDCLIMKLGASGNILWQKCLGGNNIDAGHTINPTNDGGFIIVGSTLSNDGDVWGNHETMGLFSDVWVVKVSDAGMLQWQQCLGGTSKDFGESISQTNDGGYIIAGITESNDGNVSGNHGGVNDAWVVKLDAKTSVNDPDGNNTVSVFPNPAFSELNITVNPGTYELYYITNSIGQILFTQSISAFQTKVKVGALPTGMYYITLLGEVNSAVKKFVKM